MYNNILVPIDGSATSQKALEEAVRLARLTGGRLRLLHIVDPLEHLSGFETAGVYLRDMQPALVQAGEELLEKAKAGVNAPDLTVETELFEGTGGRVSDMIIDRAKNWGADLIVLGTHGRRGIERVMMGSDAEQVVRLAPVPVLLVRHRD